MLTRVRCPLCGKTARRFRPFGGGTVVRPNARCPRCDSLERHRLIWLYLRDETDLFTPAAEPRRMLHVAPEPVLRERLAGEPLIDYLSADLEPGVADVQMDITAIDFPDDSFDVIYCSHVLEHVPDDALAMRELCRVLRPSGWAILQVPILLARTDEDPVRHRPGGAPAPLRPARPRARVRPGLRRSAPRGRIRRPSGPVRGAARTRRRAAPRAAHAGRDPLLHEVARLSRGRNP